MHCSTLVFIEQIWHVALDENNFSPYNFGGSESISIVLPASPGARRGCNVAKD